MVAGPLFVWRRKMYPELALVLDHFMLVLFIIVVVGSQFA